MPWFVILNSFGDRFVTKANDVIKIGIVPVLIAVVNNVVEFIDPGLCIIIWRNLILVYTYIIIHARFRDDEYELFNDSGYVVKRGRWI